MKKREIWGKVAKSVEKSGEKWGKVEKVGKSVPFILMRVL